MERWPFNVLEIEKTDDKREIKRAYARLVKKYHPEEYPEEWKQIHEAFQAAMQYAQSFEQEEEGHPAAFCEWDFAGEEGETGTDPETEYGHGVSGEETYEDAFLKMQSEGKENEEKYTKEAWEILENLPEQPKSIQWQELLSSEALWEASEEVLWRLLQILKTKKLKRKEWKLIGSSIEKRHSAYLAAMQFEKARVTEEMLILCSKKAEIGLGWMILFWLLATIIFALLDTP